MGRLWKGISLLKALISVVIGELVFSQFEFLFIIFSLSFNLGVNVLYHIAYWNQMIPLLVLLVLENY